MAQVPLAAVFTQDDLHEQASYTVSDESDSTPLLRLSKAAIEDGYDSVCIPLTNEAWRTRWKKMCLTVDGKQTPEIERLAEDWRASEGPFLKAEMNITRLGQHLVSTFVCLRLTF
jgi:protein arginine N-methyltransferase 5